MSQVTTHILDTTKGKPAPGVRIILFKSKDDGNIDQWSELAAGVTNADGRISDLLEKDVSLEHGHYKMRFEVGSYFKKEQTAAFYPYVDIIFEISSNEHYHVPLLLNPFGYATYRGS